MGEWIVLLSLFRHLQGPKNLTSVPHSRFSWYSEVPGLSLKQKKGETGSKKKTLGPEEPKVLEPLDWMRLMRLSGDFCLTRTKIE